MVDYDCTKEVINHRHRVWKILYRVTRELYHRGDEHDQSKLRPPEKQIFDEYTPKLKTVEFGSDEYKAVLEKMGDGLLHHYYENRHHPEHFHNGVEGMTLIDLIEMVADWKAAADSKGNPVETDFSFKRFHISEQLGKIINNTLEDFKDYDNS